MLAGRDRGRSRRLDPAPRALGVRLRNRPPPHIGNVDAPPRWRWVVAVVLVTVVMHDEPVLERGGAAREANAAGGTAAAGAAAARGATKKAAVVVVVIFSLRLTLRPPA